MSPPRDGASGMARASVFEQPGALGSAQEPGRPHGVSGKALAVRRPSSRHASNLAPDAAALRLVQALVARGLDTFFGVPGGPVCALFEAIRLTPAAHLVESRHESHAAFAASLFYRASGRVPVVVVTAGPGITNAVTGIASASLERIPMLVIAGDVAWATSGARMAQDSGPEGIAMEAMVRPITRAQLRASHARSVVTQALRALDVACDRAHPGPVLFALPLDRSMHASPLVEVIAPRQEAVRAAVSAKVVRRVAGWLRRAQRPLIVLGAGCRDDAQAMARLVDAAAVAFTTTPRAKGLVSEEHPCSLRNAGMAASMWARAYTQEPIDFCLVLGTDLDDTSMGPTPFADARTRLVHVDTDASVFGRNLPTALAVTADVGAFARALAPQLGASLPQPAAERALAAARARPAFDVPGGAFDAAVPVRPHRVICDLEGAADPRAAFVSDIGEHMLFALHYLTAKGPDRFYLQLNLGSMGSGIAGAVGLAIADRSRPVVCIAGDGGMQMAGMEALVALQQRLSILFVVLNDGRYNMVHHGMKQIFGQAQAYETPPVDFAQWATAMGMPARVVVGPGQVTQQSVAALLAWGGPALLDVRIDAGVRIRGGGRVEALQHMSMLHESAERGKRAVR